MDIERLKTDVSLWPDGATHCIDTDFTKWVDGYEFCYSGGKWVLECSNGHWQLDDYDRTVFEVIERPSPIIKAIESNGLLLDAHTALEKAKKALERYTVSAHYFDLADGQLTIMQEEAGQDARNVMPEIEEALSDIEEAIDLEAGRVAHG